MICELMLFCPKVADCKKVLYFGRELTFEAGANMLCVFSWLL